MALAKFSFSTNYASFVSWQVASSALHLPLSVPCLSPSLLCADFRQLSTLIHSKNFAGYMYIERSESLPGLHTHTPTHTYFSYRQADGLAGFVLNSFVYPRIRLKVKGEESALLFSQALRRHFCMFFLFFYLHFQMCK